MESNINNSLPYIEIKDGVLKKYLAAKEQYVIVCYRV